MARPKLTDQLSKQQSAVRRSMEWRRREGYDELWKRMVDLYRGKHYEKETREDRMLVNMAFSTKNIIAPSVAVNNPKFTVNARKQDSAAQAIIAEQVLNYLWRTHKYQADFRLAVDDFLCIGHGWLKVFYKATKPPQVKPLPDDADLGDDEDGVDDRDETVVGNAESEVRSFTDDDRPMVERLSPFDVFVDPDARHPKEMAWIAQRTKRRAADVMVDSRYDPTVRAKAAGMLSRRREGDDWSGYTSGINGNPSETDVAYVDVWEFYDLRRNTVAHFMLDVGEGYLIKPQPMPYSFGHPFVMLRNYEVPDHFYPMGELESIEALQHELNATRSQMMNHRKRFQRKYLYDPEMVDDRGLDALRDDRDNVLVPVNPTNGQPITNALAPMPQMGTPPDFYNQSELIASDIDRVTGTSDYMRGAQANIRRTATEAAMIQDAQNGRAADKLARIEDCLAQLGARIVQLLQQYMTGERVVRIVGASATPVWVQFDADYIKGEFDFEVEGGSTQPRNDSFRRQSALQLMDAMAPFLASGLVNAQALLRHVLQFGFDVKNPDTFLAAPGMGGAQPGVPPEQGALPPGQPQPPALPQGGGGMETPQEQTSPIEGLPPEIVAQLIGKMGLSPSGGVAA